MKAHLMYRDQDLDLEKPLPSNEQALIQDLELNTLFSAMASDDPFLFDVAKKVVLSSVRDLDTLQYRQDILKDCLKNRQVVRDIYRIPIESIEQKKRHWYGIFSRYPSGILHSAVEMLQMFVGLLGQLRSIASGHAAEFESEGFNAFFAMIEHELDGDYFAVIQDHLKELKFRDGVLISAVLGQGNEGADYTLRKPIGKKSWTSRVFAERPAVYTFYIDPRDDQGGRALAEIRDRGINLAANALAQAADHINSFLDALRKELAFYMGCLNLSEQLGQFGKPVCFPVPAGLGERKHSFRGLYDVCLALTMKQKVVGNDVMADGKEVVIITGANQGGKSTFLRSIGLAQLMMQCGMFVPAESFSADICQGLFTHYKRKEDATMKSGKLDEELARMSGMVDSITPNALILFNESFAATNEREGSEIAWQIVSALLERHIKIFFVTHMYEFARRFDDTGMDNAIYLRAERKADGGRTFRVVEGAPQQTSYGLDLYRRILGTDPVHDVS